MTLAASAEPSHNIGIQADGELLFGWTIDNAEFVVTSTAPREQCKGYAIRESVRTGRTVSQIYRRSAAFIC
jgi:hypothetical protein